ncbi:MAG TPA: F0F1 ATP synthase subunit delta, partial [Candidatus Saccharimonadales bacterium]|nr:F0F1 ATP synthase subunit delta [Candidatus Saccharimonadales bacterium]
TAEIKTEIERQARRLYPGAKRVMVSEEHDPEVIGGVRLSLADRQWDLSVEAKLNQFKQLTMSGKE